MSIIKPKNQKAVAHAQRALQLFGFNYRLMDMALTGQAVMHCSQTTQRDRKKLS